MTNNNLSGSDNLLVFGQKIWYILIAIGDFFSVEEFILSKFVL